MALTGNVTHVPRPENIVQPHRQATAEGPWRPVYIVVISSTGKTQKKQEPIFVRSCFSTSFASFFHVHFMVNKIGTFSGSRPSLVSGLTRNHIFVPEV